MSNRKRLLYVVYEPGDEALGYRMARHGRDTGTFDVILWTPYGLPRNAEYQPEALQHGALFLYETNSDGSLSAFQSDLSPYLKAPPLRLRCAEPRRQSKKAQAALRKVGKIDPDLANAALQFADAVLRRTAVLENWIARLGIDALVLPEENVGRDSASWIEAARLRGIPTTVITTWIVNPDYAELAYRDNPDYQPAEAIVPILRSHLPNWVRVRPGYALTRLPIAEALGLALTGLAPPDPWCVNTHPGARVAVESAATISDYAKCGVDTGHLVATGAPSLDELALSDAQCADRKTEVAELLGIDPNLPICLLNPPPNRHANKAAPEFPDYETLLEAFVRQAFESWSGTLIVSPHPATTDTQRDIIRAAGGHVVNRPAIELMPIADIYASAISSTIQMALAAALPVVCYEVYRYDAPPIFLSSVPYKADTVARFGEQIYTLNDVQVRLSARKAAQSGAEHWGRLDGLNFERVVTLAFDKTAHRTTSPSRGGAQKPRWLR